MGPGESYSGLTRRSIQLNSNGQKTLNKPGVEGGAQETMWCHVIMGHMSSSEV